jgi:hypothetical protein
MVAIEYVAALLIGWHVGFHYTIPFASYMIAGASVISLGFFAFIAAKLIKARSGDVPLNLPAFVMFATAVALISLHWAAITWLKVMLPLAVGFWADPAIASADHALFGADLWRVSYPIFGWAAPAVDRVYVAWAPVKFAVLLYVVLVRQSDLKTRALISYFLIGIACSFLQYALPSAGPVFFSAMGNGPRFDSIPVEPWVQAARAYLWSDYLKAGGDVGAGISAMPSVHVAAALWVALVVRSYFPRLQLAGFAFFFTILLGSVMLGWHYALDGLAAVTIALFAWKFADTLMKQKTDTLILRTESSALGAFSMSQPE